MPGRVSRLEDLDPVEGGGGEGGRAFHGGDLGLLSWWGGGVGAFGAFPVVWCSLVVARAGCGALFLLPPPSRTGAGPVAVPRLEITGGTG